MTHEPDFPPLSPRRRRPLAGRAAIFARHSTYHGGGANSLLMTHPSRTPGTGIHNAARYHDKKGRPVFSSGRLKYGRVPYDTFPDSPPVRCAGTTRSGAPCRNWAVLTKTLCRWHGNRRLMRPPCRAHERPINFRHGGRAHRWGSRGCLGYDVLQERKRRRLHPDVTTKPELDWKGMPLDRSLW